MEPRKRVVVIGAGFGGLAATRALERDDVSVTLIDRQNHHLFQPLLYQVATAGLSAPSIAAPIRKILRKQKNVTVLLGEVEEIDTERRCVKLADGEEPYDYLIVAPGATTTYFGHPEWADHAPSLKTLEDAREIRTRLLLAFENAEREKDDEQRRAWLTFVIVGGGPTGVELAGSISELTRHTLAEDYRHFHPEDARILLVEAEDRVLSNYPEPLTQSAQEQLEKMGVELHLNTRVTHIDEDGVELDNAPLAAKTTLWTAGVKASPLLDSLGAEQSRGGQVLVEPDFSLADHPEVFVIGDAARIVSDGEPVPGIAPAAIQAGVHAAQCIRKKLRGEETEPFHYKDRGSLATIGRASAVGVVFGRQVTGLVAWLLWCFVHVVSLIGFYNRVIVLLDWIWGYLTYQRVARVVSTPRKKVAAEPVTISGHH
ncbi:MAG: NAD(P)/FAD-dependent oxidoreductase [Planctomycetota bacterium]